MARGAEKQTAGIGKGTPGPGRKPGIPNKATTEFRETVRRLLEDNSANVSRWLMLVAEGDDKTKPNPAKALEILTSLAEYASPKLSRVEATGADGKDLIPAVIEIVGVAPIAPKFDPKSAPPTKRGKR